MKRSKIITSNITEIPILLKKMLELIPLVVLSVQPRELKRNVNHIHQNCGK